MKHVFTVMSCLLLLLTALSSCGRREPAPGTARKTAIELDSGWMFRQADGGEWRTANVPGCVHSDLQAAGIISDPFHGDNEKDLPWIGEQEWIYTCAFSAGEDLLSHDRVEIVFEGLDTYAQVTLNGRAVLTSDNMFRKWTSDIKDFLRLGDNTLQIRFIPPGPAETARQDALGFSLPGGDRVFTRKAAYQYGWDWGPRLITCGIWRPARIIGWSGAAISSIHARTIALSEESAVVRVGLSLKIARDCQVDLVVKESESGWSETRALQCDADAQQTGTDSYTFDIHFHDPPLWWPAGLGDQNLQRYTAEIIAGGERIDSIGLTAGIREIELITEGDDTGESFYFTVNGVPVYMKGANWIPAHSFPSKVGQERYRDLITSARDANMNMLRVWGGGIYENDIFYDLCDSLGILVWQDFMYACAMYPGDQGFLDTATEEASQNIIRLRNHPCLALWCGNNENYEGWHNWGWQNDYSGEQKDEIWKAYESLFDKVLPGEVESSDASAIGHARRYHPSSPRYGRADSRSLTEGDSHYWGVWHDAEPFEILEEKVPRFMSEFGFQSLPSMKTIEMFTAPGERHLDSEAMKSHQKHPRGYDLIRRYMEHRYRVPKEFEDYVYVSQLLQAEGMRIGLEAQRRAMPRCMGSLYWQLNDCWPAVSWSSIDFLGEWKALHYAARRAFAPLLVSTAVEQGSLNIYIVSDRLEELVGWLSMRLAGFGGEDLWKNIISASAPSNGSRIVYSIPIEELLSGRDRSNIVFSAEFDCPGEKASRAIRYFVHPKAMKLPAADISFEALSGDRYVTILLESNILAKDVFLQLDGGGHFSDNFFDMLPGDMMTVTIDTDIPAEEIRNRIKIKTLRDSY